jgi:transposase
VAHRNARLTVHGRRLLVHRVRVDQRPVAHVAKELGVSRQCAHRWVARYDAEGDAGLHDRSSRPHHSPTRTPAKLERKVLTARKRLRCGPAGLARHTGVPAATCGRILRRHGVARLADCDPLTGQTIRATRHSPQRYERDAPGDLIHVDVKKIGRIPDGGGWRAHGRSEKVRGRGIGYDYVHAAVDDHTRLAYAEILPDEKGATAAAFLTRAAGWFAQQGITIQRVITDNAFAYRHSQAFKNRRDRHRRPTTLHQTPLPLDQRQSRTIQPNPANRMGLPTHLHQQHPARQSPTRLAQPVQQSQTPQRTGRPTTDQPAVTKVMTEYT